MNTSTIIVRYSGQVAQVVGVNEEHIGLNGARDVRAILLRLVEQHGDVLRRMTLDESNQVHSSLLLFVNGEQIRPEHHLKDGDTLQILTPMAGG